jgi:nucleoside-diphosphate-sugar epimerase
LTTYLVGHRGWLGRSVLHALPEAVGVAAADVLELGIRAFPSQAIHPSSVVINVAGAKRADDTVLRRLNTQLPALLVDLAEASGARVVHVGSAAEYGLHGVQSPVPEAAHCLPESEYGRTKLAGSRVVAQTGRGCVLRLFNIASAPPQPGSPLSDVLGRVRSGVESGTPIELLSARTGRDWITRAFVVRSIVTAAEGDSTGIFNIASGRMTLMSDLAIALAHELGCDSAVEDARRFPPTALTGDPTLWREASGLAEALSPVELARVVLADAGSGDPGGGSRR